MLFFGSVRKACAAESEVKLSQTCVCGVRACCASRAQGTVPLQCLKAPGLRVAARAVLMRGNQGIPKTPGILGPSEGLEQEQWDAV